MKSEDRARDLSALEREHDLIIGGLKWQRQNMFTDMLVKYYELT